MRTNFKVAATGFHDEDTPLVYTFSYRHMGSSDVHPLRRIISSVPEFEVKLPGSPKGLQAGPVQLVVTVCDALDACTEVNSDTIEVTMVKLEVGDIRTLGSEVATMATNNECVEGLSLLVRTLQTAQGDKDTSARFKDPLCSLHSDILAQCSSSTSERMDCTELETAARVVDFMISTDCTLSRDALTEGMRLSDKLQNTTTRFYNSSF